MKRILLAFLPLLLVFLCCACESEDEKYVCVKATVTIESDGEKTEYISYYDYNPLGFKEGEIAIPLKNADSPEMFDYVCDSNGNEISTTCFCTYSDPYLYTSEYDYDEQGRILKCTSYYEDGYCATKEYSYDENGNYCSAIISDDDGVYATLGDVEYDKKGNKIREVGHYYYDFIDSSETRVWEYEYMKLSDYLRSTENVDKKLEGTWYEYINPENDSSDRDVRVLFFDGTMIRVYDGVLNTSNEVDYDPDGDYDIVWYSLDGDSLSLAEDDGEFYDADYSIVHGNGKNYLGLGNRIYVSAD